LAHFLKIKSPLPPRLAGEGHSDRNNHKFLFNILFPKKLQDLKGSWKHLLSRHAKKDVYALHKKLDNTK